MRKRKADTSHTPLQRKTHLGFKEMASDEDWQEIHTKTRQMLISNGQQLYRGQTEAEGASGGPENGSPALIVSPVRAGEEDTGYKQSSLLDHFKMKDPHTKEHKQAIVSPASIEQHPCTRCLRSLSRLSACSFCEREFCPTCVGSCSGCGKSFCSVCSQIDYSDSVEERLFCFSCSPQNN